MKKYFSIFISIMAFGVTALGFSGNGVGATMEVMKSASTKGATSKSVEVLKPPSPQIFAQKIAYIGFDNTNNNNSEIYVVNADGAGEKMLTNGAFARRAVWSPDGSKIAFASVHNEIFVMDADGSPKSSMRLTSNGLHDFVIPAWSPDSSKIAFVGSDGNIHVINTDGTGEKVLTSITGLDFIQNVVWSPDGTKIVFDFIHYQSVNPYQPDYSSINIMNADGTGQKYLTYNLYSYNFFPAWSPDGSKIAFFNIFNGYSSIYIINADGTGQKNLTSNISYDNPPAWSPDGTKIAFESNRNGNYEIYVMDADGSPKSLRRLTYDGAIDPAWSPDGNKIAFESNRNGHAAIYVMNADGTDQKEVSHHQTFLGTRPAWSP